MSLMMLRRIIVSAEHVAVVKGLGLLLRVDNQPAAWGPIGNNNRRER